jgi:hypothetical protein
MLGACSVPPLDLGGKPCPCVDNYVCVAGTCQRSTIDAAGDAADESCLGPPGAELYSFTGTFDWAQAGGSWSASGQQITQTGMAGSLAVAYEQAVSATSYRVTTTVSAPADGANGELGVALSVSNGGEDLYECMLAAANTQLAVKLDSQGNRSTLGSVAVPAGIGASVTMEANLTTTGGNPTISCCLRGLASAKLLGIVDSSGSVGSGPPGLATFHTAATFDTFVVTTAP